MTLTRLSNPELLKLPDCGGLLENGKCKWLNVSACTGAKCSYHRKMNSLSKARERLRSLDEASQERISQKYYGGSRPWMDASE
jgi:hypothetical protein